MNNSTSLVFKNFVQKSVESETQKSRVITTFMKFIRDKKGYYGAYLHDGKIYFHTNDFAVNFFIPTEKYRKVDGTFLRMLDEIGEASPTAKTIEKLKKKLNGNKIKLTKLHWFKNKSGMTKLMTFLKNHFILPTDFWTRNVTLNDGSKDTKTIFKSTDTILLRQIDLELLIALRQFSTTA